MSDAFRDPKHIPVGFYSLARELTREGGPKEIERDCGSMKIAQQLRTRWYHCRRIAGSHKAENAQQASDFLAIRSVSARVVGTHIKYYRSLERMDVEDMLQKMAEEFGVAPSETPALPAPALVSKTHESLLERWLKPKAAQSAPGEAEGARNASEGEGEG